MIDASPPDWGDEKLGLPLVSIRPGIVARIGGEIHVPPCESGDTIPFPPCERGIQGGYDGPAASHASASPRSPGWDNPIPCLVPHMGKGASVVRGLVSTRRGSEESVRNAPFWPGVCATRLQHAAPFGSWLQGPGVNVQWGHGDEAVEDVLRDVLNLAMPVFLFALIRVRWAGSLQGLLPGAPTDPGVHVKCT